MKKALLLLVSISFFLFSCNYSEVTEVSKEKSMELTEDIPELKSEVIKSGEMEINKTYYQNGQIKIQGNLLNGKREGKWVSFYEDGMPWSETWFSNSKKHGSTIVWYKNGQKFYQGHFQDDKESGKWIYWDEFGSVLKEVNY